MRTARITFVAFFLTTAAAFTSAGNPIEDTVRALDDRERVAALERNIKALEELWSEDFAVNAPNNRVVVGRKAVLDAFVRSGVINFSSFERTIEYIKTDGDKVILMGLEVVTPKNDAPAAGLRAGVPVKRRFTNIWKREGDTWRLYWRHANVIATR